MALIDVSALLDDPDFIDQYTYTRRVQTVGSDGVGVLTPTGPTVAQGSIQAATAKDLARFPDDARAGDWIRIYTRTALLAQDEAAGIYADLVTWRGRLYQVNAADDWSNYGAGYTKVLARHILAGAP
jgi:hypothetical protein